MLGIKAARDDDVGEPVPPDEFMAMLASDMAEAGVGFGWTRWSIDQLRLFLDGRAARRRRESEAANRVVEQANVAKVESPLRYVVSLR